jgi:hypothetical protein
MCRNGHLHSKQYLAEDCQKCRRLKRQKVNPRRFRLLDGTLLPANPPHHQGGS